MPLVDRTSQRTHSRLATVSSSLRASHSRTQVLTPSVGRAGETSASDRTAGSAVTVNSSRTSLTDTGRPVIPGTAVSAGPASVARAATGPLADRILEHPAASPGLPSSGVTLPASDKSIPSPRPDATPLPRSDQPTPPNPLCHQGGHLPHPVPPHPSAPCAQRPPNCPHPRDSLPPEGVSSAMAF